MDSSSQGSPTILQTVGGHLGLHEVVGIRSMYLLSPAIAHLLNSIDQDDLGTVSRIARRVSSNPTATTTNLGAMARAAWGSASTDLRRTYRLEFGAYTGPLWTLPMVAGFVVGFLEDLKETVVGIYGAVADTEQLVDDALSLFELLVSPSAENVWTEIGKETGEALVGELDRISGLSIPRRAFAIGRHVGPTVAGLVISIVTAGAASAALASGRFAGIVAAIRRIPGGSRLLRRIAGGRDVIPDAETVHLSPAAYATALSRNFPGHALDDVMAFVDDVGERAARRALRNPKFVDALSNRDMRRAGQIFHREAELLVRKMQPSNLPSGWAVSAEEVIQAGSGGSRVDLLLRGPADELIEIDWKTRGRSALRYASQMRRHAGQTEANIGGRLVRQESRSWVDYVRPLFARQLSGTISR